MQNLVTLANGKTNADGDMTDLYSHVYFQVHAQQVNVRDKANGKLIVSIRK
ncbi:MAG: hypothetical protein KGI25_00230 [Thaumarchaeota archaeon]|nr:hypothetical protein [Nitrososphaerota archaeon]